MTQTAELVEAVRYEQSLSRGEDWHFDNELSLAAKISTLFSLKVSNVIRYVNEPVGDFETTDMIPSAALVAKF